VAPSPAAVIQDSDDAWRTPKYRQSRQPLVMSEVMSTFPFVGVFLSGCFVVALAAGIILGKMMAIALMSRRPKHRDLFPNRSTTFLQTALTSR
jgi:hypothetical protein